MAVYVDAPKLYVQGEAPRAGEWFHIMADTSDELRAFARKLGLQDEWLQCAGTPREHYDSFGQTRYRRALKLGAKPVTTRKMVQVIARKRRAMKGSDDGSE